MPDVVLLYDPSCPNVSGARSNLMRAFAQAEMPPSWREFDLGAPDVVEAGWRGYGSPTVLVDGEDVAGDAPGGGASCRIYTSSAGRPQGVPPVQVIADRLRGAAGRDARSQKIAAAAGGSSGWESLLAALPGIGVALLPKVACPACWPAYAGVLSAVGLGFLLKASYLLPLTAVFLAIAVFALAFRARRRRGYGPFGAGLVAAAVVMVGKFTFDSDVAMYAGISLLVGASFWNSWPLKKTAKAGSCPTCVTSDQQPSTTMGSVP